MQQTECGDVALVEKYMLSIHLEKWYDYDRISGKLDIGKELVLWDLRKRNKTKYSDMTELRTT